MPKKITKQKSKVPIKPKKTKKASDTDSDNSDDKMYNTDSESENEQLDAVKNVENIDDISDDDKFGDDVEVDEDDQQSNNGEINDDDNDNDDNDNDDNNDEKCFYKNIDNPSDDEDDYDSYDEVENDVEERYVTKDERISKNRLTKYERVRLLADRTKQLSLGAKPMLKNIDGLSDYEIAQLELSNNVIPLVINRPTPGGNIETWKISELYHD